MPKANVNLPFQALSVTQRSEHLYLGMLSDLFTNLGWQVEIKPSSGNRQADLIITKGNLAYVVELKVSSEVRRDRVLPLLSQAILQANSLARDFPGSHRPLAVIAASKLSLNLQQQVQNFAEENAPNVAIGIFDREGNRFFIGSGLDDLNSLDPGSGEKSIIHSPEPGNLFSDLNQWMLKVLLAPFLAPNLLNAPRATYRNVSELAAASEVSVMSAFRFIRQLRQEGFLDEREDILRLVRMRKLLELWRATHLRSAPEIPLRWILSSKNPRQLASALKNYSESSHNPHISPSRFCLSYFAAADELGLGFVHGVPASFYLEKIDKRVLKHLGLSSEDAERSPDVHVRVPSNRESVFRGAVVHDGVPSADAIQVWLDVYSHPSRGRAQAEEIERRVLKPILSEDR